MSRRTTSFARTAVKRRKWSTSPTMPGTRAPSIDAPSASRWVASRIRGFGAHLLATTARMFAFLCHHLQIPVRHARAGVGPGIASHNDLGAAGGGHHDPSDDPSFMQRFVSLVDDEHRKSHFPDVWDPHKPQKPCLLSPADGSTSSLMTSTAPPLPNVHTICGLQQALKMLGYRIAVDGDYGPETRRSGHEFPDARRNRRRWNCRRTDGSKATQRVDHYAPDGHPPFQACLTAPVILADGVGSPLGPCWDLGNRFSAKNPRFIGELNSSSQRRFAISSAPPVASTRASSPSIQPRLFGEQWAEVPCKDQLSRCGSQGGSRSLGELL